jgi:hypothetical protein
VSLRLIVSPTDLQSTALSRPNTFSIHYPDLGFDSRRQIWLTFFAKVLKNPSAIASEDLDRLAKLPMNGRQVYFSLSSSGTPSRNVVSSAQCIALDANADMSVEHIDAEFDVVDDWRQPKRPWTHVYGFCISCRFLFLVM